MFAFFKSNCYITFWLCVWITIFISFWNNIFKFFEVTLNCCIFSVLFSCCSILIPLFKFIACFSFCFWLWNCYFLIWIYKVNCNFIICNLSASCWINYKCYCFISSWFFWIISLCLWNDIFQTIKGTSNCCVLVIDCRDCRILIPCSKCISCVWFCCWWVDCYIFCWINVEFCNSFKCTLSLIFSFNYKSYFLVSFWLFILFSIFILFWNNRRKFCWFCCYCYISFSNFKCVFYVPFFKLVACFFSYSWFDNCRVTKFYTWIFLNIIIFYFW